MKKTILYIAMSLDGYIADNEGNIDWLGGQDPNYQGDYGYSQFIENIDTVVMGYTTYDKVTTELSPDQWPYEGLNSYVLTHREMTDTSEIKFINQPVNELLSKLNKESGKSIWICGGANIIHQFIEYSLIDEYHLSIMPVILGNGIRLFGESEQEKHLRLIASSTTNGVLDCIYHKR